MGKPLKISIIICTYNRARYLFDTLRHIAENDFPTRHYEIVLIDNNSTDHTIATCQRFEKAFPEICFRYFLEQSQGLSFARNRGMKEARGELLVFLDDDAFVHKDYLKNLEHQFTAHPDHSIIRKRTRTLMDEPLELFLGIGSKYGERGTPVRSKCISYRR